MPKNANKTKKPATNLNLETNSLIKKYSNIVQNYFNIVQNQNYTCCP